jgi:GxxExxY protein
MTEIVEKNLSYQIVQAAYEVFISLGSGFLENIYEEAMAIALMHHKHKIERQKAVSVRFQGQQIGIHKLDLVVDQKIILELKAVAEIAPIHKQQALSYLEATALELALVINFGAHRLQVARVVNTKKKDRPA